MLGSRIPALLPAELRDKYLGGLPRPKGLLTTLLHQLPFLTLTLNEGGTKTWWLPPTVPGEDFRQAVWGLLAASGGSLLGSQVTTQLPAALVRKYLPEKSPGALTRLLQQLEGVKEGYQGTARCWSIEGE